MFVVLVLDIIATAYVTGDLPTFVIKTLCDLALKLSFLCEVGPEIR